MNLRISLMVGLAVIAGSSAVSQQVSPCDDVVLGFTVADDTLAYRHRGDRCEGRYGAPHTLGGAFRLIAVVDTATRAGEPGGVSVSWRAPSELGISWVRGVGRYSRIHYRMDAQLSPGINHFFWPDSILRALSLAPSDIAIRSWRMADVLGDTVRVHLPVSINAVARRQPADVYSVEIAIETALDSLKTSIKGIDETGAAQLVSSWKHGPIYFGDRLQIPADMRGRHSGVLRLRIQGFRKGVPDVVDVFIEHRAD